MNIWIWACRSATTTASTPNGTMCGGAYHPANGYIHSTFAAANDAKHCNYWINNGTGDGFSSHLHAAAQSNWVAKARMERGMRWSPSSHVCRSAAPNRRSGFRSAPRPTGISH
jgi:hypothetical protein